MSPVYRVEVETEGREVYYVQADSEDAARARWEAGEETKPSVSEVTTCSITSIEEADE